MSLAHVSAPAKPNRMKRYVHAVESPEPRRAPLSIMRVRPLLSSADWVQALRGDARSTRCHAV